MSFGCTGFIQIAITVLANLMDYHSDKGGQVKRFFSIEEVLTYVILVLVKVILSLTISCVNTPECAASYYV